MIRKHSVNKLGPKKNLKFVHIFIFIEHMHSLSSHQYLNYNFPLMVETYNLRKALLMIFICVAWVVCLSQRFKFKRQNIWPVFASNCINPPSLWYVCTIFFTWNLGKNLFELFFFVSSYIFVVSFAFAFFIIIFSFSV